MDEKSVGLISVQDTSSWKVYVDGVTNQQGARVGLVLVSPEKIIIEKSLRLGFSATNNEAEYEALLVGMITVQKMGRKAVEVFSDSRLIVGQVKGELKARDTRMREYLSQVSVYKRNLNPLTCHIFPDVRIPMQIPWQPLPPPRHGICPG